MPNASVSGAVRYQGVVCASVLLPEKLSDYYLTYITDPSTPFTAVVEMTSLVDPAELGGRHLVYLPEVRVARGPDVRSDQRDRLQEQFLGYLERMAPNFDRSSVEAFRVSRVRQVYAIPTLGYSRTMPPTSTSIPSLQIIGSANLPFSTLNIDDTLSLVDEVR